MSTTSLAAFASLRRFADVRPGHERCDLCARALAPGHRHLMESSTRRFVCACDPCAILFGGPTSGRFRGLPSRPIRLDRFEITEANWDELGLPIRMAFFARSSEDGRVVAHYPGPAGATESPLDPEAWRALEAANPGLLGLLPEVQALLINHVGSARDHYLVPADEAFRLVGLIRGRWRGFNGGPEV